MKNLYLDRIFYPDITFSGLNKDLKRMISQKTFSNFGPIMIELVSEVRNKFKISDKISILPVSNGFSGFEAIGYFLNMINNNKSLIICDIGFASQWQFTNQFFKKTHIISADENYTINIQELIEVSKNISFDTIYITATYGQCIKKKLEQIVQIFPNKIIIADIANALLTSNFLFHKNIFYVASLHATKLWGIGEGGILFYNKSWDKNFKSIINYGIGSKKEITCLGINGKMSEISAAIAKINLANIDRKLLYLKDLKEYLELKFNKSKIKIYGDTSIILKFPSKKIANQKLSKLTKNHISTHKMYLNKLPKYISENQYVKIHSLSSELKLNSFGIPFHTYMSKKSIDKIYEVVTK